MSGDCNGTIDQEAGEVTITMNNPTQCAECPENGCPGKDEGRMDREPSNTCLVESEIPDGPCESEFPTEPIKDCQSCKHSAVMGGVEPCRSCMESEHPYAKSALATPADHEPKKIYDAPVNAKADKKPDPDELYNNLCQTDPADIPPEIGAAINAFGTISMQTLSDIMAGTVTGFLIIGTGPTQTKEWTYCTSEARVKAMASIAANDLEKKLKTLMQPGYMGAILNDLLKL